MVNDGGDNPNPQQREQPKDASETLLAQLYSDHVTSEKRNQGDSTIDNGWVASDQKSIAMAADTKAMAQKIDEYIKSGGTFGDEAGQSLAQQFIKQLRGEHDDHTADRAGAAEYFGKTGMSDEAQGQVKKEAQSISENAGKLLDPHTSESEKASVLDHIEASARGISVSTGKADQTSKDVRDMKAESGVIATDVVALRSANLTPEQRQALYKDIASKAGTLIPQELADINSEGKEIKNDNNATRTGGDLESMLISAMQNPGGPAALEHIQSKLQELASNLNAVQGDRQFDMTKEPLMSAANSKDSADNDKPIIDFTDPYKK